MSGWMSGGKPVSRIDFRRLLSVADRIKQGDDTILTRMQIPAFAKITGKPIRIMKGEVTTDQFRQFVDSAKYAITGDKANLLVSTLPGQTITAIYLNLNDGRAYAKWLSEMTGRSFRLPTEKEWLDAAATIGSKLSGSKWEWTETPVEKRSFALRCLHIENRHTQPSWFRDYIIAVRLVEDLK